MKKQFTKLIASILIGGVIIWGVTGCGNKTDKKDNGTIEYEDSGSSVKGVKVPANFPKDIPLYTNGTYTSISTYENGTGGYIMITEEDPSKVLDWYRSKLVEAGWKIEIESTRQNEYDSIGRFDFHNSSDTKIGTMFIDEHGDNSYQVSVNIISGSSKDMLGN
jgi:hypothetical protein